MILMTAQLHTELANRIKASSISEGIIDLVRICSLYGDTPEIINSGNCEMFAHDIVDLFPEARIQWSHEGDAAHCFVVYQGRYYDAECSNGVDDWNNLPFFSRNRNSMAS